MIDRLDTGGLHQRRVVDLHGGEQTVADVGGHRHLAVGVEQIVDRGGDVGRRDRRCVEGQPTRVGHPLADIARSRWMLRGVGVETGDQVSQRQIATLYDRLNQYRVVMEVAPEHWQSPETLRNIYVLSPTKGSVPLSS